MAQRVHVTLVDDIDGSDASESVSFALDGVDYEIDLSDQHAVELREAVGLYVGHARRIGGRRRSGTRASATTSVASAGTTTSADVREWARTNGYEVSDRGRVSARIRAAFAAAS